ncbi:hypothetical protein KFE25_001972 [Diacronema lutheri]|uniref:non-specific serine/threonine protein kinase n=1 Tax=Diacronema lutheri TaxID=2081491 RepID=A0A8J5XKY2_DIALT|nr:hypothetical protein KFE25_001972 [Diacronema lutheri]
MPLFEDIPGGVYALIKKLGKGSYGTVYLVRNKKTSNVCCLKKMSLKSMSEQERMRALQEAQLLAQLNHPNIVAYVDSFVAKSKLHLFMQYCEGGDLDARLVRMKAAGEVVPETLVLDWASQMAFALSYLHEKKVLHRDLKAANVFLTGSGVVKLGDFGVSRVLSATQELASTFVGTPYYLSPELLGNQPYNSASDVWAYGCIVYEMCTYAHPFEAADFPTLAVRILNAEPPALPQPPYSEALASLVAGMLRKNPSKRTGLREVLASPIVRARMARFVEEFVAPAACATGATGGGGSAPAGARAPTVGKAVRAGKQPGLSAVASVRSPPSLPVEAHAAAGRAGAPTAHADSEATIEPARPPTSGSRRTAAGRPTTASAQSAEAEAVRREHEALILAEIEFEKARLQDKMAALEREQMRVAAQQQQSSSLRAFQRLLEHAGGGEGEQSAEPPHPPPPKPRVVAHGDERWPALPGEPGWAEPVTAAAANAGASPPFTAIVPGAGALDRTLSAPTSPAALGARVDAGAVAGADGGSRAHADISLEGTVQLVAGLAPPRVRAPALLEATLDAVQLGLGLDGGRAHALSEPPTRTLDEWSQCYAPSADGKGLRIQSQLSHSAQSAKSAELSGAGAGGHAAPQRPPVAGRQPSGGEETYESDFERYSSQLEEEEAQLAEADGADDAVPLRPSPPRAARADRWVAPGRGAGGHDGVSELEAELLELQNLEQFMQTAKVYSVVLGGRQDDP